MSDRGPEAEDDVALSALIDGALTEEDAAAMRRRVAQEPRLARRLSELRGVGEVLRRTYGGIAEEPLPSRVLDLLPARPATPARRRTLAFSLAAGLGLAAGVLLTIAVLSRARTAEPPGLLLDRGEVERGSALEAGAAL